MKVSTLTKIEKWFYRIWRVLAIILSLGYVAYMIHILPISTTKYEESPYCKIDRLYVGREIKVYEEVYKVTDYTKYDYSKSIRISLEPK